MSVLQKLTEGIVQRDVSREGQAVLTKWEQTGLLEGINNERTRQNMAVLLENQAKELLREASAMAAGDVEGFAAVAFPIVRRVFGGLIANDLVSVQPMSLPSGLIFFLDFTKTHARVGDIADGSIYGGEVVASQLTGGVSISGRGDERGFYNMSTGYSAATGSASGTVINNLTQGFANGASLKSLDFDADLLNRPVIICGATAAGLDSALAAPATAGQIAQCDPGVPQAVAATIVTSQAADALRIIPDPLTGDLVVVDIAAGGAGATLDAGGANDDVVMARLRQVRRHTKLATTSSNGLRQVSAVSRVVYEVVKIVDTNTQPAAGAFAGQASLDDLTLATLRVAEAAGDVVDLSSLDPNNLAAAVSAASETLSLTFPIADNLTSGQGLGAIVGTDVWGLEEPQPGTGEFGSNANKNVIPEIDIKVDSVAVTAETKKLKAKWTPELAQDLNAYHNLDAEVELTGILSEQIALEIDQEILGELVRGATAGTMYWSRQPGKFLNRETGADLTAGGTAGPDFTGTVSEWYETLIETINDVSAQIHRKTLRGGANFLVCSPEIANLLEFTSGFRAKATHDEDKGSVGAVNVGSISKKFDVYVDPYFLRNVILVGRKGSSFLESGFVYAPYVPLQTTPTIFGTEDFVPRKGVMTRYAKKMVRPDLYGLVVCRDLLG